MWLILWYPYAAVFPHRKMSHYAVAGTLSRAAYLLLLLLAAARVAGIQRWLLQFLWLNRTYVLLFLVGWMAADVVHIILDARLWKRSRSGRRSSGR
jgi:uncharacterized metal-binding protein